jgi:hypothetical protein
MKDGKGVYKSDTETYNGEWVDDHKHGYGVLSKKDGMEKKGIWEINILVKPENAEEKNLPIAEIKNASRPVTPAVQ